MAETTKQFPRTVWLGMSLAFGLLGLAYLVGLTKMERTRPAMLPVIGQISDFTLTNQNGQFATLADLTNHVWVADIIFTRCAGPCPRMTGQMKSLQDLLPPTSDAKLVTLTTDPDFDTPSVMKRYGEHFGADFNRWTFLTGTKAEIAALASGSLKLSAMPVKLEDQKSVADLFIHTTIFVVVDKHAQLRGIFETGGDGVDWTNDVQSKLLATIHQLEHEP
jgi:cytochrome oxidase Cu insertion factor (SCO1/SenC/PrrC family)